MRLGDLEQTVTLEEVRDMLEDLLELITEDYLERETVPGSLRDHFADALGGLL